MLSIVRGWGASDTSPHRGTSFWRHVFGEIIKSVAQHLASSDQAAYWAKSSTSREHQHRTRYGQFGLRCCRRHMRGPPFFFLLSRRAVFITSHPHAYSSKDMKIPTPTDFPGYRKTKECSKSHGYHHDSLEPPVCFAGYSFVHIVQTSYGHEPRQMTFNKYMLRPPAFLMPRGFLGEQKMNNKKVLLPWHANKGNRRLLLLGHPLFCSLEAISSNRFRVHRLNELSIVLPNPRPHSN